MQRQRKTVIFMEKQAADHEGDDDFDTRHKEAVAEFKGLKRELEYTRRRFTQARKPITGEEARAILRRFSEMLRNASRGKLDPEGSAEAASLVRAFTGGRVTVEFEKRPEIMRGRSRGRARFTPILPAWLLNGDGMVLPVDLPAREIVPELRPKPKYVLLSDEVHRLYYEEKINLCEIGRRLKCGENVAYRAFQYWFGSRRLKAPALPRGGLSHTKYNA